jgi:hypothetical protein
MTQTLIAGIAALALVLVAFLLFLALRDREATRSRVMALFRRGQGPAKTPDKDHYYKPYWS